MQILGTSTNRNDGAGKSGYVTSRDKENPGIGLCNFANSSRTIGRYHRHPQRKGLKHPIGQPFMTRRENKQVGMLEVWRGIRLKAQEMRRFVQAEPFRLVCQVNSERPLSQDCQLSTW